MSCSPHTDPPRNEFVMNRGVCARIDGLRVALVSHACVMPGYRTKAELIARDPRVDLTLIVPTHGSEGGGQRISSKSGQSARYRVLCLPAYLSRSVDLHFYKDISRHLGRIDPDIIHLEEEPWSNAACQVINAIRERRLTSKVILFTWDNIYRNWRPFRFKRLLYKTFFEKRERRVLRSVDYAIAGNTEAAVVLRKKGYIGPVKVMPQFGVDPSFFRRKQGALSVPIQRTPRRFTVGYVGRIAPEKGVQVLMRALSRIHDIRLLIIGNGSYMDELLELARQLELLTRLTYVQAVPYEEVPDYLSIMDLLVLPSLTKPGWKEQFGRVLIEAMACEVPVVGSDSGAIPEVIGDAGVIFPEGDVRALRERILLLKNDRTLRTSLAYKGRQRVLRQFTMEKLAKETFDLYREVLRN